jgi:hypothetical protein
MSGALQQQADSHLDRRIVIHDQYACQSKTFSGSLRESYQRQVASYAESPGRRNSSADKNTTIRRQKAGIKTQLSARCRADTMKPDVAGVIRTCKPLTPPVARISC